MKQYGATLETFPVMARQAVLTREQFYLRCFQYCLKDAAMTWYMNLRPRSLVTWSQVCKVFFNKYFLSQKVKDLRLKIASFVKEDGEPFHEAWERFNLLLAQIPPHTYHPELKNKGKTSSTDEHINVLKVVELGVEEAIEEETISTKEKILDISGEVNVKREVEVANEENERSGIDFPVKLLDLGSFEIEVEIENSPKMGAVFDMGASINMMPLEVYKHLKIQSIKPTSHTLIMADNSSTTPVGIVEEVYLNVHSLIVPVEFVVLD
ncbi:hypothetical protein LWI28_016479 [Acer negundo]|uniref:Retrotransposon gag domain-containing protein n=1 Tax=Acer negundo TaxID=4023 RepID=A0AAD5NFK8_ACENE|nr:hypothetical protein LWI28_016479 [Acer negundo]